MSTAVMTNRLELDSVAATALKAAALLVWRHRHRAIGVRLCRSVILRSYRAARRLPRMEVYQWLRSRRDQGQLGGRHACRLGRRHHVRRRGAIGSASPQPLPGFSSLERAHLHADCCPPQRRWPL